MITELLISQVGPKLICSANGFEIFKIIYIEKITTEKIKLKCFFNVMKIIIAFEIIYLKYYTIKNKVCLDNV